MNRTIRVLFLEAQEDPASDSNMHRLVMRHLDRRHVEVFAACNPGCGGRKSRTLSALESVPELHVMPMDFGRSMSERYSAGVLAKLFGSIAFARSIVRLTIAARHHRIDVIHASSRPRDAVCAVFVAKLSGARSLIHLHLKVDSWFGRPMRWALRHCDAIVGVSQFVAQSAVVAGYPSDKIFYVLNALDSETWDPHIECSSVREEYGISQSAPLLIIASRLFYWKGHVDLLRALASVRASIPEVRLLVVGLEDASAHPTGGGYLAELRALTEDLGLESAVTFVGFRDDIPRFLAACDLYVMPSYEEPCAVVFLEAMALEKPIVALDSGGTPELVEHGLAGLLSPPHDIEGLAANIARLLSDPVMRRQMGTYGRVAVRRNHSPERMAGEFEHIYRQIGEWRENPTPAMSYASQYGGSDEG